jgi:hypothetical protein
LQKRAIRGGGRRAISFERASCSRKHRIVDLPKNPSQPDRELPLSAIIGALTAEFINTLWMRL